MKTNAIALYFSLLVMLVLTACQSTKKASVTSSTDGATIMPFEGKIIYDFSFQDKTGELSDEDAKMVMGDTQTYTIKGNRYKSEMNGMMNITQFYLGQDTLYNQMSGINGLMWIDATSNPDELIDFKIEEEVALIAGVNCNVLTINSKEGRTKYYYHKSYPANPKDYANHQYGFWKLCVEKTGALPLKMFTETNDVVFESTAKAVLKQKIDDSEFELPNLPRVKSPEE